MSGGSAFPLPAAPPPADRGGQRPDTGEPRFLGHLHRIRLHPCFLRWPLALGRLQAALHHHLGRYQLQVQHLAHALDTVSPLATLSRGYAIVTATDDKILRNAADIRTGETIHTRLAKGRLVSTVTKVDDAQDD